MGGPEVLALEEVEIGEPGAGELRIRVLAVGVNRSDVMFRSGQFLEQPILPSGLGTEAAGIVDALGEGVTDFFVGQSVAVLPGLFSFNEYAVYGNYAIVPARAVQERPAHVPATVGTSVWMSNLTAYGALLDEGGMRAGDTVVITAASSSTGLAAIQIANRVGAIPIATTRTASKRQRLLDVGAADVIVTDEEDLVPRVMSATGGRGADLVFDAVAGPDVTALAAALAPSGSLVIYGSLSDLPTPMPTMGTYAPTNNRMYRLTNTTLDPERLRRAIAFVLSGLGSGALNPIVDRTFDLTEIVEAHRYMESNQHFGKIVVSVEK